MAEKPNTNVPEELRGLAETILAQQDSSDKEAVVKIGISLEAAFTALKTGGGDKAVSETIKQSLKVLQMLYQDELTDAQSVWKVVALAVQACEDVLAGQDGGMDELAAAADSLKMLMDVDAKEPPRTPAEDPPAAAASETSQVSDTDSLAVIESVAAKLMGVAPAEIDDLTAMREQLVRIAADEQTAGAAVGHLTVAAQQLETVIQGKAEDAQAALDKAAETLGLAADVQESVQLEQTPGENVPPAESADLPADTLAESEPPDDTSETVTEPAAAVSAEEPISQEPDEGEDADPTAPQSDPEPPAKAAKPEPTIEFSGPAILPEDSDLDLLKEFIVESLDHITNAEGALLDLESNPEDRDKIDVVFRAFHTIKGTSGFLGFDRIQKCAHLAENLLDRVRTGEIRIAGGYADLTLRSCDSLRTMLEGLQGVSPGDGLTIPEDLMELLAELSDPEAAGYSEEGSSGDNENMRVGDILVAKGEATREQIEEAVRDKGDKKIGEALVEKGVAKAQDVADAIRTQKQVKTGQAGAAIEGSVRVGTSRLDSLINMVGELVIAQSMVAQDPSVNSSAGPRLQRNVSHAGKIIRELQDLTMSLRMVPLKGIFQKMNRLVRDLARKSNKKVQFFTEGEDTEIDRNMVESLNDPLVHMIRNSVDHGIESPDTRTGTGKDETGTVVLRAYHAAGNVVIELEDDGKGLDRDKIFAKALERGLVENTRAKDLSDQEVFMFIFHPGFSTAEKVTDVSGRGVGMDVVKRNIESLRGRIEVTSKVGKGTTFTVRLPLTMAITDAMILRVGEERYLLPTVSIEQSFQPDPGSISTVTGQGEMVMLRGELLPLFRLHQLFDVAEAEVDPYRGLLVVIEGDGKRCALMVDELLGQQQVVIKSLGEGMTKVAGISGGAILGDGRVGLILDASGILQLAQHEGELVAV